MTVRDWITSRTAAAPQALTDHMLTALGRDADAPESRAGQLCLEAASRALDTLLSANRFGRDDALDLLAIDALATLGFEHASEVAGSDEQMTVLAKRGARALGCLVAQRV